MTCARIRRLRQEAHEDARHACLTSAEELGLHMSCADEDECTDTLGCGFFKDAFANAVTFDEALP